MSEINYREIFNRWLMIDLERNKQHIIHADRFVNRLHVLKVISISEMETVNAETTNENKNRVRKVHVLLGFVYFHTEYLIFNKEAVYGNSAFKRENWTGEDYSNHGE